MIPELIASFFIGLGLAASVGFRVFLPLLFLSVASYFGVVPLSESWQWVGTLPAMVVFGVATLLETLAYFIPWFDNLLDAITLPAATVAGTAVMASTMVDIEPMWRWALAIIAGGGTAGLVKGLNAKTRLASTATTGGLGNPVVSATETVASVGLSALSVFLWPLAALVVILLLVGMVFFFRRLQRLWKRPASRS
ncbi:protein of unknown function [Catalinimonas alkaloidigena]|uniref:DUF4126 domain-containing protein n=1 Tax=Catalinimonas alkaloidigena TaxID=1075417 RepID=A0A1G9SHV4_9BACT|nr:DUF4126 domain-containing protein [Catalinimonas alkaloidigena]SDM34982.1 protein of unknown function [Catalinimonas alkaloidigena]